MDIGSPFLTRVSINSGPDEFPFNVPVLAGGLQLGLTTPVTFFVGENGSGKSTILETIAECCGFRLESGGRDHNLAMFAERSPLAQATTLAWKSGRVVEGFFLRAESFFNFATYLEETGTGFWSYGGKSLLEQSHGESFLSLFENRFEQGLYLLDEPEAALSPQRQLSLLQVLHNLSAHGDAQFIVATHSPILLSFPGSTLLDFDDGKITETTYEETEHYRLTKDFLNAPGRYHRYLFGE